MATPFSADVEEFRLSFHFDPVRIAKVKTLHVTAASSWADIWGMLFNAEKKRTELG